MAQPAMSATLQWAAVVKGIVSEAQQDMKPKVSQSHHAGKSLAQQNQEIQQLKELLAAERVKVATLGKMHAEEQQKLRKEVQIRDKHLQDVRTKILLLTPCTHVTDNDIKQSFDDLCQNVEDWVDIECGNLDDFGDKIKTQSSTKTWSESDTYIFRNAMTKDHIHLTQHFSEIRSFILMKAIFSFLFGVCLHKERWRLGMSTESMAFLTDVATSSETANATQGALMERRRRSETYTALSTMPHHFASFASAKEQMTEELISFLTHFTIVNKTPKPDGVQKKLVDPTLKLADMLKTSMTEYDFNFSLNSSSDDEWIGRRLMDEHKFVDAMTGAELGERELEDGRACLGKLRLCVFPEQRKVLPGGQTMRLTKSMMVLEKLD